MKKIQYILCSFLLICFSFGAVDAVTIGVGSANNVNIGGGTGGWWESDNVRNNDKLNGFNDGNSITGRDDFIDISTWGEAGIYNTIIRVARDLKNFFYIVATIFFLIICLKLIFSSNTDEELGKFKKGIIWITVGLIVMQIAFAFVETVFDRWVSARLWASIVENLVAPMIALLQTLASVFFIAMAIFAFYRLITANGNEEAVKSGKMTILYALIWFLIIRFAQAIVEAFYGRIDCTSFGGGFIVWAWENCLNSIDVSEGAGIIITIINWLNGFVAIAVMIMLIYAGAQILLSGGDEEKVKKWKQSVVYIAIWLFILVANYLILTFFLRPEGIL